MHERDWIIRLVLWINMLLWLAVAGIVFGSEVAQPKALTMIAAIGFILAATTQHVAYTRAMGMKLFRLFAPRVQRTKLQCNRGESGE